MAFCGSTPILSAAAKKISGSGLPLLKESGSTIVAKYARTPNFSKIRGAFFDAEATAQGMCCA